MRTGTGQRRKCASAANGQHSDVLKQILLIDDDPVQLRIREAVLANAGFTVSVATRAESALALLRARPTADDIGAVITDHLMPRTSGAQFVRQLREHSPHLPVIVITGLAEAEPEYASFGVIFRQKPLAPEELIALMRKILAPAA
jgi:DNA-binding NtrC family response regulator